MEEPQSYLSWQGECSLMVTMCLMATQTNHVRLQLKKDANPLDTTNIKRISIMMRR